MLFAIRTVGGAFRFERCIRTMSAVCLNRDIAKPFRNAQTRLLHPTPSPSVNRIADICLEPLGFY